MSLGTRRSRPSSRFENRIAQGSQTHCICRVCGSNRCPCSGDRTAAHISHCSTAPRGRIKRRSAEKGSSISTALSRWHMRHSRIDRLAVLGIYSGRISGSRTAGGSACTRLAGVLLTAGFPAVRFGHLFAFSCSRVVGLSTRSFKFPPIFLCHIFLTDSLN